MRKGGDREREEEKREDDDDDDRIWDREGTDCTPILPFF